MLDIMIKLLKSTWQYFWAFRNVFNKQFCDKIICQIKILFEAFRNTFVCFQTIFIFYGGKHLLFSESTLFYSKTQIKTEGYSKYF